MPPVPKPPVTPPEGAETPAPKKKAEPREYRITKTIQLDTTDAASVIAQLEAVAGEGGVVTAHAEVGVGKGLQPKKGLEAYGADNDLSGDYQAVAVNAVAEFKNVSTAAKRTVSFD